MTERGVCVCPDCGLQFSDPGKAAMESAIKALRRGVGRRRTFTVPFAPRRYFETLWQTLPGKMGRP